MSDRQTVDRNKAPLLRILVIVWGGILSAYLVHGFFVHGNNEIQDSHEGASYVHRVVEFRAGLAHGHFSPQWCPDFRGGLGAPYFSYYQPAFFYVASAVPDSIAPAKILGITVWLFALVGYFGMVALVGRSFRLLSGVVAGSLLLLSPYPGTELYVRGDLSEFAAMMCLPRLLWAVFACIDSASRAAWLTLVGMGGLLVCTHPCIAVPAFGMLGLLSAYFLSDHDTRKKAAAVLFALALGGCLAGFYSLPVFLEIDLVRREAAFTGFYHYSNHFLSPLWLFGSYTRQTLIPYTLGLVVVILVVFNAAWLGYKWCELNLSQRHLLTGVGAMALLSIFLMTPISRIVWQYAGWLQLLQFPWRLLTMATVSLAVICGPVLFLVDQRVRAIAAIVIVTAAFWMSFTYTKQNPPIQFTVPENAAALARDYIAPDLRDEWLPKGARVKIPTGISNASVSDAGVKVTDCHRDYSRLTCNVDTAGGGTLTLPHYYFPVGWRATLDEQVLDLVGNEHGLMQVTLPSNSRGALVVQFSMTPARAYGWVVSIVSLLLTILVAAVWRRIFREPKFGS